LQSSPSYSLAAIERHLKGLQAGVRRRHVIAVLNPGNFRRHIWQTGKPQSLAQLRLVSFHLRLQMRNRFEEQISQCRIWHPFVMLCEALNGQPLSNHVWTKSKRIAWTPLSVKDDWYERVIHFLFESASFYDVGHFQHYYRQLLKRNLDVVSKFHNNSSHCIKWG